MIDAQKAVIESQLAANDAAASMLLAKLEIGDDVIKKAVYDLIHAIVTAEVNRQLEAVRVNAVPSNPLVSQIIYAHKPIIENIALGAIKKRWMHAQDIYV